MKINHLKLTAVHKVADIRRVTTVSDIIGTNVVSMTAVMDNEALAKLCSAIVTLSHEAGIEIKSNPRLPTPKIAITGYVHRGLGTKESPLRVFDIAWPKLTHKQVDEHIRKFGIDPQ